MTPQQENEQLRLLLESLRRRASLMQTEIDKVLKSLSGPTLTQQERNLLKRRQEYASKFWKSYPEEGQIRSSEEKVFNALKAMNNPKPTISQLLEAVEQWKKSKHWKEGFVAGAHTWIKDRKWEITPKQEKKANQFRQA